MDCRKRRLDLMEVIRKVEQQERLDPCEELFYLVEVFHMTEAEAEEVLSAQPQHSPISRGRSVKDG